MITLKEIAREAGVSMTTVSNVINGNAGRVSEATIERIQEIIRRSGYVPNQAARSLAQRESHIVAIIAQCREGENMFRNPYMAEFIGDVTIELQRRGYYPLLRFTDDYRDVERNLLGWNVAGAVLCGAFDRNLQHIKGLSSVPAVLTDSYFPIPAMNYVCVDDLAGGRIAARYLLKMGHKNVAFIGNCIAESSVDQLRLQGFTEELSANGIALSPENIRTVPEPEQQDAMLRELLDRPDAPTALFCTADRVAVQLMMLLARQGRSVPQDVSVMGFDDLPLARMTQPQLTTLGQDVAGKARVTVEMLVRHIRDKNAPAERIQQEVWLVERGTVRRV
ncbi:MAG: LacI family DNA-binding transcriptional regulator [Candidatus Spyradocola sp.]